MLLSDSRSFPCLFGVSGFKSNQLRFAFFNQISADYISIVLRVYLSCTQDFGQNTSLVVFEKPSSLLNLNEYKQKFWKLLQDVTQNDRYPNDEIILVLKGGLSFYTSSAEQNCYAGDLVLLPSGTRHGSIALEIGAVYMIAFQFLEFLS